MFQCIKPLLSWTSFVSRRYNQSCSARDSTVGEVLAVKWIACSVQLPLRAKDSRRQSSNPQPAMTLLPAETAYRTALGKIVVFEPADPSSSAAPAASRAAVAPPPGQASPPTRRFPSPVLPAAVGFPPSVPVLRLARRVGQVRQRLPLRRQEVRVQAPTVAALGDLHQ